jgi:hypothetical protein
MLNERWARLGRKETNGPCCPIVRSENDHEPSIREIAVRCGTEVGTLFRAVDSLIMLVAAVPPPE